MSNKKLLIVEDNAYIRKVLHTFLTENLPDITVSASADGKEAMHEIEQDQADLIIMDLELPHISGLELTEKAKAIRPDTRIIIHSVYDQPLFQIFLKDRGADYFLSKEDTSLEEMLRVVRTFLENESAGPEP